MQSLLLTVLLCVSTCTTVVMVDASPAYLLAQRRGRHFTYEAKRSPATEAQELLPNELTSFLYAFTEDMNVFIKNLFAVSVMNNYGDGTEVQGFDKCKLPSPPEDGRKHIYTTLGCFKTLLHTGIASDCVAVNPFCCVQYWRYPASLPDRLPSDQIDHRLIFWDGTKAVNGFYTNFSDKYRARHLQCSTFQTCPELSGIDKVDSVLSVDANGEWRYTCRQMPLIAYLEHRVDNPTSDAEEQFKLLHSAATPAWAAAHPFRHVPLVAVGVELLVLVLALLLCLLLLYHCRHKQDLREEEALRTKIGDLLLRTEETEAKIAAHRRGSARSVSPSGQTRRSSFVHLPKATPSPVNENTTTTISPRRTISSNSPEPSQFPARSAQLPSRGSFVSARSKISPGRRRPSLAKSASPGMHTPSPSPSPAPDEEQVDLVRRSPSKVSVTAETTQRSRRPTQTFENPLIGRQSFDF
ncbi:hypothetical protein JKF63_06701 [Porcisia hertigi]|uniref:Uncharacterized protein n=1 Tax=Porcisia hertigi TaxID=2761500 RepID=A0A836LEL4_9TRYP|nr:hypothetical protein JKF63_06701 [Porcisia hertigi]